MTLWDNHKTFGFLCAGPGLVSISPLIDVFNLHIQRTVQYSEQKNRPVQRSKILGFFFDGSNIIKQKVTIQKKVNVFVYLVCVTKVAASRNWSVFNFNRNYTDIKYSNFPLVLS